MGATVVLVEGGWSTKAVFETLIVELGSRRSDGPTERMISVPDPADPSWRRRPTTYVVFDADLSLPREVQLGSAALTDEVVHIEGASHFGFMSQPALVAGVLARIATSIR